MQGRQFSRFALRSIESTLHIAVIDTDAATFKSVAGAERRL
jgi:hypothetical protein